MNKKATYLLVVIFLFLVVAFWYQQKRSASSSRDILSGKRLVSFDTLEAVEAFTVKYQGKETRINKKDGKWWTHEGYPVYAPDVEELLKNVKDTTIHSVVSFSLERREEFFLDATNTYEYIFKKGDAPLGSFQIAQGNFGNAYIIRENEDQVVSVLNPNYIFFNWEWRERVIETEIVKKFIREIVIQRGKSFTTISKKEEVDEETQEQKEAWHVNGKKANQEKVEEYVSGLTSASASSFPESDETFEPSDITIKVKTKNDSFLLSIGKNKKDDQAIDQTMIKNSRGLLFYVNTEKTLSKLVVGERELR